MSALPANKAHSLRSLSAACGVTADELLPELYQNLRRMARRHRRGERADHSLDTTAIVHEAWLKLMASYPSLKFDCEAEFLALSGHLMRRVLIDHARQRQRLKRGGDLVRMTFTDGLNPLADGRDDIELLALDTALEQLAEIDPRQVAVVELKYFAGFSIAETADLMDLSPATIKREWAMARAWLMSRLRDPA